MYRRLAEDGTDTVADGGLRSQRLVDSSEAMMFIVSMWSVCFSSSDFTESVCLLRFRFPFCIVLQLGSEQVFHCHTVRCIR